MPMTTTKRCPYCVEEIHEDAIKCKHCGTWLAAPPDPFTRAATNGHAEQPHAFFTGKWAQRRLTRTAGSDAMIYGVCGGMGRYLGVDPTWIRIVFALADVFTGILPGVVIYFILSWIIPPDDPVQA